MDPWHQTFVDTAPQNAPTWTPSGVRARVDAASLQHAYALAQQIARSRQAISRGHRIVWVRGACYGVTDLSTSDAAYAIVGRHTHADVRLDIDPSVALRHLVLRSVDAGDGTLALRILDLQTSLGFALADGVPRQSAVVRGAAAIQVGEYVLVALPTDDLPPDLPPTFVEQMSGPYRTPGKRPLGSSHIGLTPGISDLGKLCLCIEGDTRFSFTLERRDQRESVLCSELELQRGIVVGRSPKAHSHLLSLMDANVSRMHLLLVRERAETYAIDLCSMNGTWMGRERARRVRLAPGMQLRLGDSGELGLVWHGRV